MPIARGPRVWAATEEIDPEAAAELRRAASASKRPTGTVEMLPGLSAGVVAVKSQDVSARIAAPASAVAARTVELPEASPTLTSVAARTPPGNKAPPKGGTVDAPEATPLRAVLPWDRAVGTSRSAGFRMAFWTTMGFLVVGLVVALLHRM